MDGECRAALVADGVVSGMNRKGLVVPLPQLIADELLRLSKRYGPIRMDGEIIGNTLHVFDLLLLKGDTMSKWGCLQRIKLAAGVLDKLEAIKIVPAATESGDKKALWERVKNNKGEGVVFKRRDSQSKGGRPNSGGDWLKYKFTESASCIVTQANPSKRSVAIELLDDDGRVTPVGNVTIAPNHDIPAPADIVEVEYLYAYKGGSLYQPIYRGRRGDIDTSACVIGQLKFKPEAAQNDDES